MTVTSTHHFSDAAPQTTVLGATTSSGGITNVDTNLVVGISLNSYFNGLFPFVLSLTDSDGVANEELVLVTSGSGIVGDPYVITRAYGSGVSGANLSAKSHALGSVVRHKVGAGELKLFDDHLGTVGAATVHGLNGVFVQIPVTADKTVYASPRGNDSNDGLSLRTAKLTPAAAITALGGTGVIRLAAGSYSFSTGLDMSSLSGITFEGAGIGTTAGAAPSTILTFTGTGSGNAVNFAHSQGVVVRNLMVLYSSASFSGTLVNFGNTSGAAGSYISVENCYFGSSGGIQTAAKLVNLAGAENFKVSNSHFADSVDGIYGWDGTNQSNRVLIEHCVFRRQTNLSIRNPHSAWEIASCTFEGGSSCNAVGHDGSALTQGLFIHGCWTGDTSGGTQFSLGGNAISVKGNWIGSTAGTGVSIDNSSTAFDIKQNYFTGCTTAISLGGSGCLNYDCTGNYYTGVTTNISGGPSAKFAPATDSSTAMQWTTASGAAILTFHSTSGRLATNGAAAVAHLTSGGGVAYAIIAKTANYTVASGDHHVTGDTTGGAFTVTLPSAVGLTGREFLVKRISASANNLTVGTTSSQTIDGSTTYVLTAQWKYVRVISDGANWLVTANN